MSDDRRDSGQHGGPDYRAYAQMARETMRKVGGPRSGFRALPHYINAQEPSLRLVSESSRFRGPTTPWWNEPPFFGPEMLHFFFRRGLGGGRFLFESLLADPEHFEPPCMWALLWALAAAEHEFLARYVPFWSHEERLTGHFVSLMIERIEDYGQHWRNLQQGDAPSASRLRIWYADTATARQEKYTGADLGLIVHTALPDEEESWKAVRFQAKKVNVDGGATVDLDQADVLAQAGCGYYLFYHPDLGRANWSLTPTVRSAARFAPAVEQAKTERQGRKSLGTCQVHPWQDDSYDFATFVTFALSDPASEEGALAKGPHEAVRTMLAGGPPAPSRVCIVTIGEGTRLINWEEVFHEYLGPLKGHTQER